MAADWRKPSSCCATSSAPQSSAAQAEQMYGVMRVGPAAFAQARQRGAPHNSHSSVIWLRSTCKPHSAQTTGCARMRCGVWLPGCVLSDMAKPPALRLAPAASKCGAEGRAAIHRVSRISGAQQRSGQCSACERDAENDGFMECLTVELDAIAARCLHPQVRHPVGPGRAEVRATLHAHFA